ncbi:MAG: PAS domain-containing sensor histidine kinase, partial [Ktedonobacteraceae bacterium]|nr:PAS domain-containing sensor histidine kinase [Ktedonobacteraceae bacterium]
MSNEHYNPEQKAMEETQLADERATAFALLPTITMAEVTTLLDFSPEALVAIDVVGTIVLANEQAAALFGYSREELRLRSLEMLLPERFHMAYAAHRLNYVSAPYPRSIEAGLDLVGRRKDGSEFPVDISIRPVLLEQALHVLGAVRDVFTQRQMERERLQQAEQLVVQSTLINLAHDAILVRDQISRVLSWNRGAEELYGWTEKEALGRVSHTLLHTHFPTSRAAVEAQLEREVQWEGELVQTRRDGRTIVVESRQVLIRDAQGASKAFLEINRDITQRRLLEQAQTATHTETLAQRAFLQQMLDIVPSSIYVVHGQEARLVLANRAAASIWGAEWPVGQPMRAFLEEHAIRIIDAQEHTIAPEAWATMRALNGETVLQHQEMIRQQSGSTMPIQVNAVPLFSPHWRSLDLREHQDQGLPPRNGEPLALVIHQDVSLLKEAEYFKDEFIGIAAHELRQPLSVLKAAVGTLVLQTAQGHGPQLAEWQQEMLQDLDVATDSLVQLTDDLLDASRLQADQLVLQRTSTNLVALVQRVVERFQEITTRHQLTFHTNHPKLDAFVDLRRMEQVLSNLLTNAIKY